MSFRKVNPGKSRRDPEPPRGHGRKHRRIVRKGQAKPKPRPIG